jgi:hypothetical protein
MPWQSLVSNADHLPNTVAVISTVQSVMPGYISYTSKMCLLVAYSLQEIVSVMAFLYCNNSVSVIIDNNVKTTYVVSSLCVGQKYEISQWTWTKV